MFAELASILAPVYLIAALGYAWARMGRPFDTAMISDLITNVGAPCLVFASLVNLEMDRGVVISMATAALGALAIFAVVGTAVLRVFDLPRHTFLPPLLFMNVGNMGLPICYFAFGEEGLAYAASIFAIVTLAHFTVGQWVWSGEVAFGPLVKTPLTWAVIAASIAMATEAELPRWLERSTALLGDFTIPLMQLSLGVSLSRLRLSDLPRSFGLSLLRLGMGLAAGFGIAEWLSLEGAARGVFIIDCAMPAAVFNYLMAEHHGRNAEQVASVVVLSTLMAFLLLPVLLWFVLPAV